MVSPSPVEGPGGKGEEEVDVEVVDADVLAGADDAATTRVSAFLVPILPFVLSVVRDIEQVTGSVCWRLGRANGGAAEALRRRRQRRASIGGGGGDRCKLDVGTDAVSAAARALQFIALRY